MRYPELAIAGSRGYGRLAAVEGVPERPVLNRWRWLYGLNPMAGVIEGFRWALTGHGEPPNLLLAASTAAVLLVLGGGLVYFRAMESTIADVV